MLPNDCGDRLQHQEMLGFHSKSHLRYLLKLKINMKKVKHILDIINNDAQA